MAQRCFSNQVAGSYTGGCPKLLGSALCDAERKDFLQWPCNVQDRPIVMCSGTQYGDYRYKRVRIKQTFTEEIKRDTDTGKIE